MSQNSFFKKLENEFENHPYKQRYLEELEDHLEDLKEDQRLSDEQVSTPFLEQFFGMPKEIKESFVAIVDPWRSFLLISETLSMGIALGIIGIMFNITLNISVQDFLSSGILSNFKALIERDFFIDFRFPGYMIMTGIMWFFGYRFAFNLFAESKSLANLKESTWIWILLSPSLFFFTIYLISKWPDSDSFLYFFVSGLWLSVNLFIFLLAYFKYKKSKISLQDIRKWGFFFLPNVLVFTILIFFDYLISLKLNFFIALSIFILINFLLFIARFLIIKLNKSSL